MDHSQAIAILLAFAERPGDPPPGLGAAVAHVTACPTCGPGAAQLLASLRLGEEDRLTCAEGEELLPAYLGAIALGQPEAPAWADLRVHLAGCPACSAALADLAELRALADGTLGAEPPAYPAPRRQTQSPGRPAWRIDELGRLLVELGRALIPTAPGAAVAGLKAAPGPTTVAEATVGEALPDLELHIAVEGRPESERRALVVTVSIPSRGGWPNLGGSEVALLHEGGEVARATTDAFGTAAFPDLDAGALAGLSLAVRPGPDPTA